MAARIKPHHQDEVRQKIQASQLVNFLQNHALKGVGSKSANTRVRAALGLLGKTLPDLSSIQHSGDETKPIRQRVEVVVVDPQNTRSEKT